MPEFNPPRLKPGDVLTAKLINELIDALRQARNVRAGPNLAVRRGAGNTQIAYVGNPGLRFYVGKASGSITARSGTTPGSGTVDVWDASSGTLTIVDDFSFTVKNPGTSISSGKYVSIQEDPFGTWWVAPLECE